MKKEIKNETACYAIYFITQNGESRSTNEDRTNLVIVTRMQP